RGVLGALRLVLALALRGAARAAAAAAGAGAVLLVHALAVGGALGGPGVLGVVGLLGVVILRGGGEGEVGAADGRIVRADGGARLRGRGLEQERGEVHLDLLAAAGAVVLGGILRRGAAGGGQGTQIVDDGVVLAVGALRLGLGPGGLRDRLGLGARGLGLRGLGGRLRSGLVHRRCTLGRLLRSGPDLGGGGGRRSRGGAGAAAATRGRGGRGLGGDVLLRGDHGAGGGALRLRDRRRGEGGGSGRGAGAPAAARGGRVLRLRRVVLGFVGAVSHAAVSFWRTSAPWSRLVIVAEDGSLKPSPSRSSTVEALRCRAREHCGRGRPR